MTVPEGIRKLEAILAADVAGYSRLMQPDDERTVAVRAGRVRGAPYRSGQANQPIRSHTFAAVETVDKEASA